MLTIEIRLKVDGRELWLDGFAETFLGKIASEVGGEIERRLGGMWFTAPVEPQEKRADPKAVGIKEAARILGVSHYTVRLYAAQGKPNAVRFGRRVMIPMESVKRVSREGVAREGGLAQ